jgi:hypothetical protein
MEATMTDQEDYLAEVFGPAAHRSEYRRGERIRYKLPGEGQFEGSILWAMEPGEIVEGHHNPLIYVVLRDGAGDTFPDIVWASDVIES